MKTKLRVHNLIYQYFLLRIHFQYYQYGDSLPSIDTLCRAFSVSAQTVTTALQQLRAEGYIDMHNGRQTKVLFRQTEEEYKAFTRRFFSERLTAASDLARTSQIICAPAGQGTGNSLMQRFFISKKVPWKRPSNPSGIHWPR